MKKSIITSVLAVLVTFGTTGLAQDYPDEYLGLPGDNLNLYAVMKLFQESETLEGFERSLNDENSRINNLDLNGDNYVDYLTVNDFVDGDVHTIVLRAVLNKEEYQDVAVFTVQKFPDQSVQIQLVGDETLYGKNYIIEPYYEETPNPGYVGKNTTVNVTVVRTTPYQVAAWPVVRFIYMPRYVVWRSSWYWGYYPRYWRPWRPFYWHYYYGYHYNWYHYYYRHFRYWPHYRYNHYNNFYFASIRVKSPTVIVNIRDNKYRSTYARPEQRRDGEALYTKLYPSQNKRTAEDNILAKRQSEDRRSASQAVRERQATGTTTDNARRPEQAKSSETTRRATNATTTRTVTTPEQAKSSETTRRSTNATTTRTITRPQQETKSETTRRSTQSVSNRASSRSEQATRAQSSRSTRSSETRASNSTTRSKRSSSEKATKSSSRSTSSKKKDDSNSSSRRR